MTIEELAEAQRSDAFSAAQNPIPYSRHGETIQFRVFDSSGKLRRESPEFTLRDFKFYSSTFQLGERQARRLRVVVVYTLYRGSRGSVRQTRVLRGAVTYFLLVAVLRIPRKAISNIVRYARVVSLRQVSRRKVGYQRSRSLRPSPETIWSSFAKYQYDLGNFPNIYKFLGNISYKQYERTWTGTRTPNFASAADRGQLPVNPHTVSIREQKSSPIGIYGSLNTITGQDNWTSNYLFYQGRSQDYWSEVPSHLVEVYDRAVKRLIGKSGNQLDANLAQDLVQIDQMTRLVATTTRRMVSSVSALRKGNIAGAVKALWQAKKPSFRPGGGPKVGAPLASNWLEMQYGWKPLMQDIHGSMASIAQLNLSDYPVSTTESSAHRYLETVRTNNIAGQAHGTEHEFVLSICKIGIRWRVGNEMTAFLAQTGFTNPLNLAWEVLPFSFVVDWFLPLGPYLETLSAWDGLVFMDGYQVQLTRRRRIGKLKYSFPNQFSPHITEYGFGWAMGQGVQFNRGKIVSFPELSPPRFKDPFSATHAANGVALLVSTFRGR